MPRIFVFLLICLLLSCANKEQQYLEFDLEGQKKIYEEIINPEKIRIKSNSLFVLEGASMDAFTKPIHLIDLEGGEYLDSYGEIGFGPGEISDATSIDFMESDSSFYIYSSIDKRYSEFNLANNDLATNQIKQKNKFFKAYSVLRYSDSTLVGLMVDSPARMVEFSFAGDSIASFGELENFSERKDLDNFNIAQLNMGWFSSNVSKSHFAIAYLFTNKIDIFSQKSGEFTTIYLSPKEYMKFDLVGEPNGYSVHWDLTTPYHFRDVVLTAGLLFALYGGYSETQIQENSEIAKTVYVFSMDGKMIAKFNLDTSIKSFAISEDLSKIYGISTDQDPGIVEFDVPEFN